ncbi:hypothetical protein LY90DRAFT_632928 [Neocallimastix californiae]|uniref:Protein NO VEIN C-terminal domain-containing protein n=1 Tax=Neocallimastix californiae TaxID=1754190 RepID=A0A1Y2ETR6_9FUNG|nr:hypothetical protein LY90DRAFT_632928 [Neocallimastix californiae]|eukprot:ORY74951.1 hypothetical protein LY90DRAFT_632928 [Neocallimastix californiae]
MINEEIVLSNTAGENFFEEERKHIFGKVYLANVANRLRELVNANDVDCKRWIWELVQNAKDSISGQPERTSVNIKIIVTNDTYVFMHDGSPFNKKTIFALLYKFSEGKTNNSESTGRFGTGFLTTHTLSKTVEITSDIEINNQIKGFSVTMYREGDDQQLLEGLSATENSFRLFKNTFGWTSYKYKAVTNRNREAGRLGIENFKENIDKVMLFCPEINSIELNDNGKILTINRGDVISLSDEFEEFNGKLTERFNRERNIRIHCAIELDGFNNIINNSFSPSLFCSLPLVGSEDHELPFIINSPDFEPDSERQSIFLNNDDIDEKTGKISDSGINRMILKRSQTMFRNILKCVCNNDIMKRYILAKGLRNIPQVKKFFDREWYKKYFIDPMRNILHDYPIVWNGTKYVKLNEVYIPDVKNYKNRTDRMKAYRFIYKLYDEKVPSFNESLNIEQNIWRNDNRIKYINIEQSVKLIESYKTISSFETKINSAWNWLDDFLLFVKRFHPEFLEWYAIIPNMENNFVKLTKTLASSTYVPENMIEYIESINIKWRENHIHKKISKFSTGTDHNIDFAVSKIRGNLQNWSDNILKLMKYIPLDSDKWFIEKRNLVYELCATVWNFIGEKKDGTKFPKDLWNGIDDMVFRELIKKIEYQKKIGGIYSIKFMNKFLGCVSEHYTRYINYSVVPNQNGTFCKLYILYNDNHIPDLFKNCLKSYFNLDIKNELIHNSLTTIKANYTKSIYNYADTLKKYFEMNEKYYYNNSYYSNYMSKENKIEAAKYLIRIIPKNNNNNNNEIYNDEQNNQRKLFDLYKIFTCNNYEFVEIDRNENNYKIWSISNKYIYDIINKIIESKKNINSLSYYIEMNENDTINHLKTYIEYFSSNGKIIPNQNCELCYKNDLCNEGKWDTSFKRKELIPDELKDIAKKLGYDVRSFLLHEKMSNICLNNLTYSEVCEKIDKIVTEKFEDPKNYSDPKYKEVVRNLIDNYFVKIGEKDSKKYFLSTFSKKEHIIINVIIDKETRANLAKLTNKHGDKAIPKFLNNPEILNGIMKGELSDESYKSSLEKIYGNEAIQKLKNNPKIIESVINGNLSDDDYQEKIFDNEAIQKLKNNPKIIESVINGKLSDDDYQEKIFDNEAIQKLKNNPKIIESVNDGKLSNDDSQEKIFDNEAIQKLKNNPKNIESVNDGKLSDEKCQSELEEKYGNEVNSILLNNPNIMKDIINGDLSDENYKSDNYKLHGMAYSTPSIVGNGSKSISIAYSSDISPIEKSEFINIIKYSTDFCFENPNEKTGITGEAYIYELLLNSRKFKNVKWKMLNEYGDDFKYNGNVYKIRPEGSHYDIEVETYDNRKFYVEVKSTKYEFGNNKVPFFLSKNQIDLMKLTELPNKYLLAIVFNTMSYNPTHFFLTMNEDIE